MVMQVAEYDRTIYCHCLISFCLFYVVLICNRDWCAPTTRAAPTDSDIGAGSFQLCALVDAFECGVFSGAEAFMDGK